jgi:hypothetical protein
MKEILLSILIVVVVASLYIITYIINERYQKSHQEAGETPLNKCDFCICGGMNCKKGEKND